VSDIVWAQSGFANSSSFGWNLIYNQTKLDVKDFGKKMFSGKGDKVLKKLLQFTKSFTSNLRLLLFEFWAKE